MKKYFGIFAVFIILTAFEANAQDKKTVKEQKIKQVTVYEEKSGKGSSEKIESITVFDKNGNVVEEKEFNSEGKLKKHVKTIYNENGHKIKETELDESGEIIEVTEYKYKDGLKIEKTTKNKKGEILETKRYEYSTY